MYLKNIKDLTVKTYIADKQGNYRFNALSVNADYEVHAETKDGRSSDVRRLSSFDSRKLVHSESAFKIKGVQPAAAACLRPNPPGTFPLAASVIAEDF